MAYLIGTDEAGYAPNLGPLIISCTVWHVADQAPNESVGRKQARPRGKRKATLAKPGAKLWILPLASRPTSISITA